MGKQEIDFAILMTSGPDTPKRLPAPFISPPRRRNGIAFPMRISVDFIPLPL